MDGGRPTFCSTSSHARGAWPPPRTRRALRVTVPSFLECPKAMETLAKRWSLLRHEKRLRQLSWEVQMVLQREQDLPLALTVMRSIAASIPDPPTSRIVVASSFIGEDFQQQMRPARNNHERWCARHGYTYACLEENIAKRSDPTWSKIPHVLNLLQGGAEWVFWMDADSLFISDGADLQWACDLQKDFVFAGDLNVVFNAGHFLARRGAWAEAFLSDAFQIHPWPDWEDNGAMMILLGGGSAYDPSTWRGSFERMKVPTRSWEECQAAMRDLPPAVAEHVAVVPQHWLNAYEWPKGGGSAALIRGDPILHFAGCAADAKPDLVAHFAERFGDPFDLLDLLSP
ncbi:unnamed protein product, partial [Durusdinium trenchii]